MSELFPLLVGVLLTVVSYRYGYQHGRREMERQFLEDQATRSRMLMVRP